MRAKESGGWRWLSRGSFGFGSWVVSPVCWGLRSSCRALCGPVLWLVRRGFSDHAENNKSALIARKKTEMREVDPPFELSSFFIRLIRYSAFEDSTDDH